jgi:biofilm PGA synthesis N-glycosyltransferase PgaC
MPSPRHMRDDHALHNRVLSGISLLAITGMSMATLLVIAWALTRSGPEGSLWGVPPVTVLLTTAAVLAVVLAGAVILEAISLLPLARSESSDRETPRGPGDSASRITVVIPAHNEELMLPMTLAALRDQTRVPDRVVVVADNCVDRTREVAHAAGCVVIESHRNHARKAGALNQALARLLPALSTRDLLLIMDADTRLNPDFVRLTAARLEQDPDVSAVGGVFVGDDRRGALAQLQRNEFVRYARQLASRRGRVFVLTGTATLFRPRALEEVASRRGDTLPGQRGRVYAETAITEDNELTLALKTQGAYVVSPRECRVTTETMPTLASLWTQRLRWQRGALENLNDYGLRPSTARYWMQQWGLAYGSIALPLSLGALLVTPLVVGQWVLLPFWLLVTGAFSLERGLTAWDTGWRGRAIAFALVPEIIYSLFLQACFIRGLAGMMADQQMVWGHLAPGEVEARA